MTNITPRPLLFILEIPYLLGNFFGLYEGASSDERQFGSALYASGPQFDGTELATIASSAHIERQLIRYAIITYH